MAAPKQPFLVVRGIRRPTSPLIPRETNSDTGRFSWTNAVVGGGASLIVPRTRRRRCPAPLELAGDSNCPLVNRHATFNDDSRPTETESAKTESPKTWSPSVTNSGYLTPNTDLSEVTCKKTVCLKRVESFDDPFLTRKKSPKKVKADDESTSAGTSSATSETSSGSDAEESESGDKSSAKASSSEADTSDAESSVKKGKSSKKRKVSKHSSTEDESSNAGSSKATTSDASDDDASKVDAPKGGKERAKKSKSMKSSQTSGDETDLESSKHSEATQTEEPLKSVDATNDETDKQWTTSEDSLLRGMKEGGASWADIGGALNRGKTECKSRWKVLQNTKDTTDGSVIDLTNNVGPKTGDGAGEAGPKHQEVGSSKKKGKEKSTQPAKETQESSQGSSSKAAPYPNHAKQYQQQQNYIYSHVYPSLYPTKLNPKPDRYFSQHDCDILASIDSKMKHTRFLEMQANFYNATGRMIPLQVIKDKMERAEAEESKKFRKERLEAWADNVSQIWQQDPNAP